MTIVVMLSLKQESRSAGHPITAAVTRETGSQDYGAASSSALMRAARADMVACRSPAATPLVASAATVTSAAEVEPAAFCSSAPMRSRSEEHTSALQQLMRISYAA